MVKAFVGNSNATSGGFQEPTKRLNYITDDRNGREILVTSSQLIPPKSLFISGNATISNTTTTLYTVPVGYVLWLITANVSCTSFNYTLGYTSIEISNFTPIVRCDCAYANAVETATSVTANICPSIPIELNSGTIITLRHVSGGGASSGGSGQITGYLVPIAYRLTEN
jgi:hypothetical protein